MKVETAIFIFALIVVQALEARSTTGMSVDSQEIAETREMALKLAKHVQKLKSSRGQNDEEEGEVTVEIYSQEIAETREMALKMAKHVQKLKSMRGQNEEEEDDEYTEAYVKSAPLVTTRSNHRRHFATKSQAQMVQQRSKTINKKFLFLLPLLFG
uniref:Uncharacterized protein n=1 Tax=Panagrolaimus sp. ES5 TaxID=591445 RepID=A0AC34FZ25_9BILA